MDDDTTSNNRSASPSPPPYQPSESSSTVFARQSPSIGISPAPSTSSSSPSSSSRPSFPSTAPTTPALSAPHALPLPGTVPAHRTWRPTPHVPSHIRRRHRAPLGEDGEDRNRWLSEDEGLGGSSLGVRRRRRSSGEDGDHGAGGGGGGGGGGSHGDGPPRPGSSKVRGTKSTLSSSSRPAARRVNSYEPVAGPSTPPTSTTTTTTAESSTSRGVGAGPPRIQDIVTPPSTTARVQPNPPLSPRSAHFAETRQTQRSSSPERNHPGLGIVPDYVAGRGGDGIGAVHALRSEPDDANQEAERKERRELLEKLRRILGCALCPSTPTSPPPPLHHPITLPCGHTLSSSHVSLPLPPIPPNLSNLPAHEAFAAQQKAHDLRLSAWQGVMCPIPTCKRYDPRFSTGGVVDVELVTEGPTASGAGMRTESGEMLPSGVHYYPPPPSLHPPAYSAQQPNSGESQGMMDVSIDKVLGLVQEELENMEVDAVETDTDEPNDEVGRTRLSHDFERLDPPSTPSDAPPSPIARRKSKRRRNTLSQRPPLSNSAQRMGSDQSAYSWGFKKELLAVLECDVCAMLLYEPVTTPCQHSFCGKCLSRSLDHSSRCPVCRQDLPSFAFFQDHAVNKVLWSIIKTAFPAEYVDRRDSLIRDERDARLSTPIFVCTLAFPGMPTILHVFEPRYRLMIRRCIESNSPRFGMLLPSRSSGGAGGGVMEYGTMLEIQSVQMLPDGRSMVETVGTHRFRLMEKGNLDGYTIGRIERIDDIPPEEEAALEEAAVARAAVGGRSTPDLIPAPAQPATIQSHSGNGPFPTIAMPPVPTHDDHLQPQTTEEYMAICRAFIEQLRSGSAPWLLQRLNNTYGTMPEDPSEFSFWMALVMPIDEYEKARLLPIRSPRLRLKLIVHWVESLRSSWWFSSGCVVG